jgi:hypothetical protein
MQGVGARKAEVSCIKLQSRDDGNGNLYGHTSDYDVEKATVKPSNHQITKKPGPETLNPPNHQGKAIPKPSDSPSTEDLIVETHIPPDQNEQVDDEKDDFPEEGVGWFVLEPSAAPSRSSGSSTRPEHYSITSARTS